MAAAPSRVDGKGGCLHEQSESMRVESRGCTEQQNAYGFMAGACLAKKTLGMVGEQYSAKREAILATRHSNVAQCGLIMTAS